MSELNGRPDSGTKAPDSVTYMDGCSLACQDVLSQQAFLKVGRASKDKNSI